MKLKGNQLVMIFTKLCISAYTPSGPTYGGPNAGSIVVGALLWNPGENAEKVGTILPLSYQSLCRTTLTCRSSHVFLYRGIYIPPETAQHTRSLVQVYS